MIDKKVRDVVLSKYFDECDVDLNACADEIKVRIRSYVAARAIRISHRFNAGDSALFRREALEQLLTEEMRAKQELCDFIVNACCEL